MSGKLIMKRKLDKTEQSLTNKVEIDESSASSSVSILNNRDKRCKKSDEAFVIQSEKQRICCDTPPPEPSDLGLSSEPQQVNQHNRHLLEVIQLKMLELQNELEAFEHDVEAREEYYINDSPHNRSNNQMSEQDAEALGFAMCAQETLLFLQREGIPSDSILYTRLRNSLVGRSQSEHTLHL